jgi:predicted amidophosphoribosyltransferase
VECRECKRQTIRELRLCSHCGWLLGSAAIARRVLRKRSQLERFGLAGSRRPLLKKAG